MTAALIFGGLGGWLILGVLVAPRVGRMLRRPEPYPLYPPPLPQPAPWDDWFREVPSECLSDAEIRPLFDDIVRGLPDGTWSE